jgi:hypothetical protein
MKNYDKEHIMREEDVISGLGRDCAGKDVNLAIGRLPASSWQEERRNFVGFFVWNDSKHIHERTSAVDLARQGFMPSDILAFVKSLVPVDW